MVSELTLDQAWQRLETDPEAVLIDVRTTAEWNFVGVPDLRSLDRQVRLVEWIGFPDGAPNPDFLAAATDGLSTDRCVLVVCRSGARSRAAAEVLGRAGFGDVHNVTAGFEGDLDANGHRHGGWK
ncbi:MAG: rhodanese-like domain-containing protein, partial [Actinomycetota bacterium]